MKTLIKYSAVTALVALGAAAPAQAGDCGSKAKMQTASAPMNSADIVQTAVATDQLSTLVAAVQAAGLVDALSAPGPFTVFAPTNGAFDALPAGTVSSLLEPQNKDALTRILTSHVVAGELDAASLTAAAKANGGEASVTTLSGATLTAVLDGGSLFVRDEMGGLAPVAMADVGTSNGVVHVVGNVLLPAANHS